MFDFTSLFSSRCAVRLVEKKGKTLLMGIVGDSLHEPFWPTGSGCARGFLGVLDTAWTIREHALNERSSLEMIAERESIYRLLAQVTKDNMHRALSKVGVIQLHVKLLQRHIALTSIWSWKFSTQSILERDTSHWSSAFSQKMLGPWSAQTNWQLVRISKFR